jgi:hypothetical protein
MPIVDDEPKMAAGHVLGPAAVTDMAFDVRF